jgi:hypothetical protein
VIVPVATFAMAASSSTPMRSAALAIRHWAAVIAIVYRFYLAISKTTD